MKEDLLGKSIISGYLFKDERFYIFPKRIGGISSQLMVYTAEDDTYKLIENPFADLIKCSSLITRINKSRFYKIPPFYMKEFPSGIILTSTKLPQMLLYSDENSSISEVLAESKFYDKVEQVDKILEVEGDKASEVWRKEQSKKMHYLLPEWDDNTKCLYRWAYKLSSDRSNYDNFLFVYDSSLNLVDEIKVTGIKMKPKRLLYIGSKIYIAANFEDDLGFLVFDYTAPS